MYIVHLCQNWRTLLQVGEVPSKELLLRRVDYGEQRGAIDCIKVIGSQLYLSHDDFGCIVIQDFW